MTISPLSHAVRIHKAFGHPIRLRILALLRGGPLCVCQLTVVVKLAASTVSEHLAELRNAGLVEERKQGRWVEYRLSTSAADNGLLDSVWALLRDDRDVTADSVLIRALRRVSVGELCGVDLELDRIKRPGLTAAVAKARRLRQDAAGSK